MVKIKPSLFLHKPTTFDEPNHTIDETALSLETGKEAANVR
jgi:hypothetical protein